MNTIRIRANGRQRAGHIPGGGADDAVDLAGGFRFFALGLGGLCLGFFSIADVLGCGVGIEGSVGSGAELGGSCELVGDGGERLRATIAG